jgi:hypothetical protein
MRLGREMRVWWVMQAGGLAGCAGGATGAAQDMSEIPPLRAEQAPLVTVRQIVESAALTGRRVRVAGACALAGSGPSTGVWVLESQGFAVEVRGLVPRTCFRENDAAGEVLTIFAQVEPKGPESGERLLLRLPD